MTIVIPMTGYGSRFVAAGYHTPKPFLPAGGRPVLEWIVKGMYPGEEDFLFICRRAQVEADPALKEKLLAIAPGATVAVVDEWQKQGPVADVLRAAEHIPDDGPAIINYCDFYQVWDWPAFKREVAARGCAGCVPCYTGFHPHLLHKDNLYASCRVDEAGDLIEIREKYSFAADKMRGLHSPGVYHFATGALLKTYCQKLMEGGPALAGEYYASLPYNYMVADGLKVWVPACVEYFCQWGTPADYEEYLDWIAMVSGGGGA